MKLLPLYKEYKKKIILVSIMIFLINIIIIKSYKMVLQVEYPQSMPQTMLYYQGNNFGELLNENIQFDYTYPLYPDKQLKRTEIKEIPSENKINLTQLRFMPETSKYLVNNIAKKINNNILNLTIGITINETSSWINETTLKNENLGVEHVLKGRYPSNENEVMISEMYAVALINETTAPNYESLIGKEISIIVDDKVIKYKISGIYLGANNNFIINPSSKYDFGEFAAEQSAAFIKFSSKREKKNFKDKYPGEILIGTENFKGEIIKNGSIYVLEIILVVLTLIFLKAEIKEINYKLNFYFHTRENIFKLMIFFIVYLLIIIVIPFRLLL